MITREQLLDVEDRIKLVRLGVVAALVLAIAFIWLRLAAGLSPSYGSEARVAPAAANHAAGVSREVRP